MDPIKKQKIHKTDLYRCSEAGHLESIQAMLNSIQAKENYNTFVASQNLRHEIYGTPVYAPDEDTFRESVKIAASNNHAQVVASLIDYLCAPHHGMDMELERMSTIIDGLIKAIGTSSVDVVIELLKEKPNRPQLPIDQIKDCLDYAEKIRPLKPEDIHIIKICDALRKTIAAAYKNPQPKPAISPSFDSATSAARPRHEASPQATQFERKSKSGCSLM